MKKNILVFLTFLLLFSLSNFAFAAASEYSDVPNDPFRDVPTTHWAYAAIAKLAKADIIDGYGDKIFDGNHTLTRYEMAQLVAKAVAKEDKANAEDKAIIDKLTVEFAAELKAMDVRVAKLEKKTNIWFMSETRMQYAGDNPSAPNGLLPQSRLSGDNSFWWRERLHMFGTVSDNTTFTSRLVASGQFGETGSTNNANGLVDTNNDPKFDRLFLTTNNVFGLDQIIYGRQKILFGVGFLGYKTSNNDGVTVVKKIGNVTFQGAILDIKDDFVSTQSGAEWNSNEFSYGNFLVPINKNVDLNFAYYDSNIPSSYSAAAGFASGNGSYNKSDGWAASTAIWLGKWTLDAEYVGTTLKQAAGNLPAGTNPKAYAIQLTNATVGAKLFYPVQGFLVDYKHVGEDAWSIMYHKDQAGAIPNGGMTNFAGQANGWNGVRGTGAAFGYVPVDNAKGWYVVYERTVAPNTVLSVEYQDIKFVDTGAPLDKTLQTSIQFLF